MKKRLVLFMSVIALLFVACATNGGISNLGGFRNMSLESENINLADINYSGTMAGESVLIERSFENAPPLISHSIEDMLPITKDNNTCLSCHDKAIAADVLATAVPATHYYDYRLNKDMGDTISEARFNCTQCHVPQSNAKPLVGNSFKPEFKNQELKNRSNLIDVMNEGVE
ncbi:nitrate reductase cytochrome c-type subunit [Campylobacter sp. US33a]|uniref:nitrate reductase cytochrome c-type subunit n=1 Tax=Campylobacter sp. US33a TaxID=2498120 RepID=UPI0010688A71|nr:nitrate reductase cytochrome c-type subunit [Campylobacter sp. US33a]TEY01583.1 nitrate reductase [Campylobacter sp. US33a]